VEVQVGVAVQINITITSQAMVFCGFMFNIGYQTRDDCPMARPWRIEYHGAIYHVMSRGDRLEKIFLDDLDCQDFLKTPAQTCLKTGFLVHAYWDHRRGIEPVGLDRGRTGAGTQDCPRGNGHRRPVAASNGADPQMDKDAWKNRLGLGWVYLLSTNRAR
jgi:hypothetical protein